jgi:anti-repressor protein
MQELIPIAYKGDTPTVSGRELHEFLEIGTEYPKWFERMCEYGFTEDADFNSVIFDRVQTEGNREVTRTLTDHAMTLDMAKEICMIQRSEKGKIARQYFLQVERSWNSPEQIMARAHRIAEETIAKLSVDNSRLTVSNQIMLPKAEYFDELVERNLLTNFRETAKQIGVKEKEFINFLLAKKYVYRDKRGKLMPYAEKGGELFEIKECFNERTDWRGTQTLITPKGRETFRLLCKA